MKKENNEVGIMGGMGSIYENLSDYFANSLQSIDLTCLDKFQRELDLEVIEWSAVESTRSRIISRREKPMSSSKKHKVNSCR